MSTYEIQPAPSAGPSRWVVTVGPSWRSLPMPLAHLRVYVRALRDMNHRRRFRAAPAPRRDPGAHLRRVAELARASGMSFEQAKAAFARLGRR